MSCEVVLWADQNDPSTELRWLTRRRGAPRDFSHGWLIVFELVDNSTGTIAAEGSGTGGDGADGTANITLLWTGIDLARLTGGDYYLRVIATNFSASPPAVAVFPATPSVEIRPVPAALVA